MDRVLLAVVFRVIRFLATFLRAGERLLAVFLMVRFLATFLRAGERLLAVLLMVRFLAGVLATLVVMDLVFGRAVFRRALEARRVAAELRRLTDVRRLVEDFLTLALVAVAGMMLSFNVRRYGSALSVSSCGDSKHVLITNGKVTHPEGFRKTEKVRAMHRTDRNLAGDTVSYIFYFLLTVNIFLFT